MSGSEFAEAFGSEQRSNGTQGRVGAPGKQTLTAGMSQVARSAGAGGATGGANSVAEVGRAPVPGEQFGRVMRFATEPERVPFMAELALRAVLGDVDDGEFEGLSPLEDYVRRTGFTATPMTNRVSVTAMARSQGQGVGADNRHEVSLTGRLKLAQLVPTGRTQVSTSTTNNNANTTQGSSSTSTAEASASIGAPSLGFGGATKHTSSETETAGSGEGAGETRARAGQAREMKVIVLLFLTGKNKTTTSVGNLLGGSAETGQRESSIALPPIPICEATIWTED